MRSPRTNYKMKIYLVELVVFFWSAEADVIDVEDHPVRRAVRPGRRALACSQGNMRWISGTRPQAMVGRDPVIT